MATTTGSADHDKFDELAEEFAARFRRGERPALQEYIDRYPELAGPIRELFPALVEVERADVEQQNLDKREHENAPVVATVAPPLPSQVGDYRILREIGRGGMGVVYEAEQVSLHRRVALKVLPRHVALDEKVLARFRREARSAAQLHHTNIVPVFEVGKDGDVSYYSMQFIQGHGLDRVIGELRRLKDQSRTAAPAPEAGSAPLDSPSTNAGTGKEREAAAAPGELLTDMARLLLTGRLAAGPLDGEDVATSCDDAPNADVSPTDSLGPATSSAAPASAPGAGAAASPTSSVVLPGGSQLSTIEPGRRPFFRSGAHIGRQVAAGLGHAHARGIVHRDIKPSNLLLDMEGVVWISDFGLAKAGDDGLSQTGDILGTLRYMAPERFRGGGDARADTYALGLTLYELLTLRPAYDSPDRLKLIESIKTEDPPRPRAIDDRIPRDLETIVLKAIEKDPDRRYPTADALAEDLRRFLDDEPIHARRTSATERVWRWCRRRPVVAGLVATTAALLILLTVGSTVAAIRINAERVRADAKAMGELTARKTAEVALARVERTDEESRNRLVRLYIKTGSNAAERGDPWTALLWYHRAWAADRPDPRREASHRQRLAAVLEGCPRLVGFFPHASPVLGASFDPAGRRILTRTDEPRAYLWDTSSPARAAVPLAHEGRVLHAEFSPDGARVVTCGTDRTARLWDAATGAGHGIGPVLDHPDVVHWASFSPDGRTLATACADGRVRFWDQPSGRPRDRTIACPAPVLCVVFHPDGSRVLTADGSEFVRLWEVSTAARLGMPIPHRMAPGNPFDRLELPPAFSRDGQRVLAAHDQIVSLWYPDQHALRRGVMTFGINRVEFDAEANRILAVGQSTGAPVLDATALDLAALWVFPHSREVQQGCFYPGGAVTSSSGGLIHVLRSDSQGNWTGTPPFHHFDTCTRLQCNPDGRLLLTASLDGSARVWQIAYQPFASRKYDFDCGRADSLSPVPFGPSEQAVFSPDARRVVVINDSNAARIVTGDSPTAVGAVLGLDEPVQFALFSGDGHRVLTAGTRTARVWDADTGKPAGAQIALEHAFRGLLTENLELPHDPPRRMNVQLSRDGRRLAAVDDVRNVRVYDTVTGSVLLGPITPLSAAETSPDVLEREERDPSARYIWGCVLSADGRRLAVATSSGQGSAVRLYNIDTGRSFEIPSVHGFLHCLNLSDDGRKLLAGSSDTTVRVYDTDSGRLALSQANWSATSADVRVYDTDSGRLAGPPLRHRMFARLAAFGPDGRTIAAYVADGTLCVWDSESGDSLVPPFSANVNGLNWIWFSRDGRRIVGQSPGGVSYQWDLPVLPAPRAQVDNLVRLLTASEIDATDGIVPLPRHTLRDDPERFREAWLACRSTSDEHASDGARSGSGERSWILSRVERYRADQPNRDAPEAK
jgi:serine/threonine protein kinase/WD40 repeat protein